MAKAKRKKKRENPWSRVAIALAVATVVVLLVVLFTHKPRNRMKLPPFGKTGAILASMGKAKPLSPTCPEIPICQNMIVENWYGPRHCARVHFSVYALADLEKRDRVRKLLKGRESTVQDRVRTAVADARLTDVIDPELRAIKRQVQRDLDEVLGKGMVEEVLVPHWSAADYYYR